MTAFFRVFFCILSILCVAAVIPLAVFKGWSFCFVAIGGAALFAFLMILAKNGWHLREPLPPSTDFMNTEEENKKILDSRAQTSEEQSESEEKK